MLCFRPVVHRLWSADILWHVLHSHSWLSVRKECDGSLVILRIDTGLKRLGLFFCAVVVGRLKSIVKGFDKVWGFGGGCDWRARNKVTKSVLSKKKKNLLEKNQETSWVVEFCPIFFILAFYLHMHEEGTCKGAWYFFSKIWIWHPVLIITSSAYKLWRF